MSKNQGKDGEMRFGMILGGIAIRNDGIDYTRSTVTNQPDLGMDYGIQGEAEDLLGICEIARGERLESARREIGNTNRRIEARVDVKTSPAKLTRVTVKNFFTDIRRNPSAELHLLVGGAGLSPAAQQEWDMNSDAFCGTGKATVYISNEGTRRLGREFKQEILGSLGGVMDRPDAGEE